MIRKWIASLLESFAKSVRYPPNTYYGIYSPGIKEFIGVTTHSWAEHALKVDPGCVLIRIPRKVFEGYGDDESVVDRYKPADQEGKES